MTSHSYSIFFLFYFLKMKGYLMLVFRNSLSIFIFNHLWDMNPMYLMPLYIFKCKHACSSYYFEVCLGRCKQKYKFRTFKLAQAIQLNTLIGHLGESIWRTIHAPMVQLPSVWKLPFTKHKHLYTQIYFRWCLKTLKLIASQSLPFLTKLIYPLW